MKKFDYLKFIEKLIKFSPRQGENEKSAMRFICLILDKAGAVYEIEKFINKLPIVERASLTADGNDIVCESTGFIDGKINDKHSIISSLISSQLTINQSNINFNPECDV